MGPRLGLALLQTGQLRLVLLPMEAMLAAPMLRTAGIRIRSPHIRQQHLKFYISGSVSKLLTRVGSRTPSYRKLLSRDYNVFALIGVGGILCAAMYDNILPFD